MKLFKHLNFSLRLEMFPTVTKSEKLVTCFYALFSLNIHRSETRFKQKL
jgi:hypothetical protein